MRKPLIAVMIIALLSIGAGAAYAHMWGYGVEDLKALDETTDLRKERVIKKFELKEALRNGEYEKADAIEKKMIKLDEELYKKGVSRKDRRGYGKSGKGYGRQGGGCGCQGQYGPYGR